MLRNVRSTARVLRIAGVGVALIATCMAIGQPAGEAARAQETPLRLVADDWQVRASGDPKVAWSARAGESPGVRVDIPGGALGGASLTNRRALRGDFEITLYPDFTAAEIPEGTTVLIALGLRPADEAGGLDTAGFRIGRTLIGARPFPKDMIVAWARQNKLWQAAKSVPMPPSPAPIQIPWAVRLTRRGDRITAYHYAPGPDLRDAGIKWVEDAQFAPRYAEALVPFLGVWNEAFDAKGYPAVSAGFHELRVRMGQ